MDETTTHTDRLLREARLIREDERARMRTQVAAMSSWAIGKNPNGHTACWLNRDDVLALLDGGSDE
jgi:hypothetical protein